MHELSRAAVIICVLGVCSAAGQAQAAPGPTTDSTSARQLPPATKLEAFNPTAGSVVTIGYDDLGRIGYSVSVNVREHRGAGASVRGVVVDVLESTYRQERAFIDEDEIAELLAGIDALLEVKTNPTAFKQFEVRYSTRGELQVIAFNTGKGDVRYAIQAGRVVTATHQTNASDLQKLRAMFAAAQAKLAALP
jgi:hypothetical protein